MKWILYTAALLFALLSCRGNSITQKADTDSVNTNTMPSKLDSVTTHNDNTGTSVGAGTTTSGTSTGSSSSHKDSVE